MKERLRAALSGGAFDFSALALELHAWQRVHNPTYAALFPDARPRTWREIPAVPVALFRSLALRSYPPRADEGVFLTSGTTGQARGRHFHADTALYDLTSPRHFRACVPDAPRRVVSLCPDEPTSSLGHMLRRLGDVVPCFADGALRDDVGAALAAGPCLLATTAFALDALFAGPARAHLDARSVVMVTGGFKGRRVRLDDAALYAAVPDHLGAPRVVGEYGMTELSSQLWADPVAAGAVPGRFRAPPWLGVVAVDPATGAPVDGEGALRFVDLCNVDSVLAVETMDLGSVTPTRPDGGGAWVTLRGRLEGAEARGCSLRAEDLVARTLSTR